MITVKSQAPMLTITGGSTATVGMTPQPLELPDSYLLPAWSEKEVHPHLRELVRSVFPNLDEVVLFVDPVQDLMFIPIRFVELL